MKDLLRTWPPARALAYVLAGYRANRSNAARLSASRDIQKRVAEIQSLGAERAAITVETLIAEAEAARSKAMGEKGGATAAIAALTAKAKLAGLWREKVAHTDPSGENAPRYIISDRPMTDRPLRVRAERARNPLPTGTFRVDRPNRLAASADHRYRKTLAAPACFCSESIQPMESQMPAIY